MIIISCVITFVVVVICVIGSIHIFCNTLADMSKALKDLEKERFEKREYKYQFTSNIEGDTFKPDTFVSNKEDV